MSVLGKIRKNSTSFFLLLATGLLLTLFFQQFVLGQPLLSPDQIKDVSQLIADPANPLRLYAWGDNTYRSDDHGRSWVKIETPDRNMATFFVTADGTLWAQKSGVDPQYSFFRSFNGGETWESISNSIIHRNTLIPDLHDPNILYVLGGERYVRNEEDELIEAPTNNFYQQGILPLLTKSTDGGNSWESIFYTEDPYENLFLSGLHQFVISPADSHVITAAGLLKDNYYPGSTPSQHFLQSEDGGETWRKLSGNFPAPWLLIPDEKNSKNFYIFVRENPSDPTDKLVVSLKHYSPQKGVSEIFRFETTKKPFSVGVHDITFVWREIKRIKRTKKIKRIIKMDIYLATDHGIFYSSSSGRVFRKISPDNIGIVTRGKKSFSDPEVVFFASEQGILKTRRGKMMGF